MPQALQALVVTVDAPFLGNREMDASNGFTMPPALEFANLREHAALLKLDASNGSALFAWFASQACPRPHHTLSTTRFR